VPWSNSASCRQPALRSQAPDSPASLRAALPASWDWEPKILYAPAVGKNPMGLTYLCWANPNIDLMGWFHRPASEHHSRNHTIKGILLSWKGSGREFKSLVSCRSALSQSLRRSVGPQIDHKSWWSTDWYVRRFAARSRLYRQNSCIR
jgi:hypothetical protein